MRLGINAWSQSGRSFSTKSLSSEYVFGIVGEFDEDASTLRERSPFAVYDLIAIDSGIGQFTSNRNAWINLTTTVKSGAAIPMANITCPIAIVGEYYRNCDRDGVAHGIQSGRFSRSSIA